MPFTPLHRMLGLAPGPLTGDILDAAVTDGVTERSDLDWKSELPPAKGLPQTDFPKDVAAMANSGGGVIVYGVQETQKAATRSSLSDHLVTVRFQGLLIPMELPPATMRW
ncbi:AlbA family DNA-binding domain-containing protein [Streptomyces lycii]|uniref:AlbA family DNA-binding domain-containing protein n=1 Tax=Streptomyces lycii TaxID=2654337 RepID=UPI001F2361E0|nr:ATP-binding protein [Streptomyces lycii]